MRCVFFFFLVLFLAAPVVAAPISYQGQLQQQGQPFSGTANLDIRLFDAAAGGNQIGPLQERLAWPISDGLFQVDLDFGANAFDGSARFLEVRVNGTPLTPRQAVTATPQALIATTTVAGAIGTSQINATQVQRRVTGSCPAGQYIRVISQTGTVTCGTDANAGGTVTSIETGTGLTGGPITGTGSIAIANGGVGTTQINSAQVQRRVTGSCPAGQYIQSVNQAGTVVCGSELASGRQCRHQFGNALHRHHR